MKAGLAALAAGHAEAPAALPPPNCAPHSGYVEYDARAKPFIVST